MSRRDPRRVMRAATVAACLVVAGACSSTSTPQSAGTSSTTAPASAPAPEAPAPDCGNPVQSFRPDNATPSSASVAKIRAAGKLRAGVSADTLLFGARDPLTGRLEGFDIDMVRAIAAAIFGGDPTELKADGTGYVIDDKIDFKVITYADRLPRLKSNDVDIVAHTMTINCKRWAEIAFSTEYFHAGQKLLVRKAKPGDPPTEHDIDKLQGAKVCAAKGSTNIDYLATKPNIETVGAVDLTDCLVLFQQSKVDAITGDDTVLAGFVKQDPYAEVVGEQLTQEPYGIGVNKANTDLVQFINGVIEQMRTDGSWAALYEKWVQPSIGGPVPQPPPAVYGRT